MRLFLLQTPFYRILLALIIGILFSNYSKIDIISTPLLIVGCCLATSHFIFHNKEWGFKYRWVFGSGILLIIISTGIILSEKSDNKSQFQNLDKQGVFIATLSSAPKEKENSFQLTINTTHYSNDTNPPQATQGKAIIYTNKTTEAKNLRIGDKLILNTKFSSPKQRNNPQEFNYKNYLRRQGIGATSFVDSANWELIKPSESFSIIQTAFDIQKKLLEIYKSHQIKDDKFAVLAALTLGHKDEIKDELFTNYSNSGAMHILSVSGLHVGIIYLVFSFLLSFLNKVKSTRILKAILIILLLSSYAFITGLSPSVVRATIMFSLICIAIASNYKSQIYNSIFFSAFLLLIYDTNNLFNTSFLLSYSAVLSIVFFYPRLKKLLQINNKIASWSWDLACVSISAQIGTFPLALYFFHKFSNYFLLTNFIAIPTATLIIYLAILLFISFPFEIISNWIAAILNNLLNIQNKSIQFIDQLPFSIYETWISKADVILLYFTIIFTTAFIIKKHFFHLLIGIISLLILQLNFIYQNIQSQKTQQVVVYSNPAFSGIDFIDKKNHFYYTSDSLQFVKFTKKFWLKNKLEKARNIKRSENFKDGFFSFHDKTFLILDDEKLKNKSSKQKIKVDYLILTNNTATNFMDIENLYNAETIIIDETIAGWKAQEIINECKRKSKKHYFLKENGCLTIKL